MPDLAADILSGAETALVDSLHKSNTEYQPSLLSNNYRTGEKVLSVLEEELNECDSFEMSVAFITQGGLIALKPVLEELRKKRIPGKILTTDYNIFTDPKALDFLAGFQNIELRMYHEDEADVLGSLKASAETEKIGFHTKGYIFRKKDEYTIIIGSANITGKALSVNHEWNTRLISTAEGAFYKKVSAEFERLWSDSKHTRVYDDFIDEYRVRYEAVKKQRKIAIESTVVSLDQYRIEPNKMQVRFLRNLEALANEGKDRALLISATGTGKTFAAAFGMRDVLLKSDPTKRVLFIVHREQIAKQALATFRRVFGQKMSYGLLSGNSKEYDAQFLFSTMQMMAKEDVMKSFSQNEFSYIILDEAHKTGATSYQRIMEYFKPEFWLGMTASPERMDDFDVFQLFDHNIAYEIRLQQAMEEDLLCPFHYFGITDLEIDGEVLDDDTGLRNFRNLVCDQRVDYVLKQAEFYGYSGDRVKGLIFCSRRSEAEELSRKFNERGFRTVCLGGGDSQAERESAMERLTSDTCSDPLDYIFTVDIFNEGVDIPEVNQVIMLRPTQSPIVFVQQLGRGLRRAKEKEYVVVLDFIGNYKNNFMIPIALSGDRSYNKDNVRRYVMEGSRVIPGCSTIHFDEISRRRIFNAIDTANFSDVRLIKENYKNLKFKLGRIPALMDFDQYGEMDVLRIFDNNSLGSYYKFLVKHEPEYKVRLSAEEEKVIEFVSKKLAAGKRIHEIELLNRMLRENDYLMEGLKKDLEHEWDIHMNSHIGKSVVNVMTNEFPVSAAKETYKRCVFLQKVGDRYMRSVAFDRMLKNPEFKMILMELIDFGRYRYQRDYSDRYANTDLVLYQKYTYEDVCRLLGWEHNEVPLNIGGYKYDKDTKTFPVFINYDKADDIQDTVKYEDHFTARNRLIAISKSKRTVESEDVQNFLNAKDRGINVELFVRKNKDDKISKEFYYFGHMTATGWTKEFIMPNTTATAVEIEWALDTPVREDIYQYILHG